MKPIFKVGAKERCIRSLSNLDSVRRLVPGLAAHLCHPHSSVAREFLIDFHGFRYRGETNNHVDWCVYYLKNYALAEAAFIESVGRFVRKSKQRFICLESGANVGHRTLLMARAADEVITFEPHPGALKSTQEKLDLNGVHHVRLFNLALDQEPGEITLELLSPINFLAVRKRDSLTKGGFGSEVVKAVRGDDFIRQHNLSLPSLIRIRAGDELSSVLKGLADTLREAQPVVIIECPLALSGQAIDEQSLRSMLYDDVEIATFRDSALDGTLSLDPFDPASRKLVAYSAALRQLAEK